MRHVAALLLFAAVGLAAADPAEARYTAKVSGGTLTLTGDGKSDKLTLKLKKRVSGTLLVDVGSDGKAELRFPRSRFTAIVVNAGGGADTVTISEQNGAFTTIEATTLNGGSGKDTLVGGRGAEIFSGGPGNDVVKGKSGDDAFLWSPGHGQDTVDGGAGGDLAAVTGSVGANDFSLAADGARARIVIDSGVLDLGTVETVLYTPLGGNDHSVVSNALPGGVTSLDVDLGVGGAGDGAADFVEVFGDDAANTISVIGATSSLAITGVGTALTLLQPEINFDELAVYGLGGNDVMSGGATSTLMEVTLSGGDGNDDIFGGPGDEFLSGDAGRDEISGGPNTDVIAGGDGDDEANWGPGDGNDDIFGGNGVDELVVNGSAAAEGFQASSNGSSFELTRNVGAVVLSADTTEELSLTVQGGADNVTVNDLTDTDLRLIRLDLGVAGLGDIQTDQIIVNGTSGADVMSVSGGAGSVFFTSPLLTLTIFTAEPLNDLLTLNGLAGADAMSAAGLAATSIFSLTMNGGTEGDALIGSQTGDTINGDAGDDAIQGGPGADVINCGANTDYADGGLGTDLASNCETTINVP
jgi:Ca2+-binding RTX toxin-like protein